MKSERWAAWMWYRGDRFHGFQSQGRGDAVQDAIARALFEIGARRVALPAGRTDRGVHARMQVVDVRLPPGASVEALAAALDAAAPAALGLVSARRTKPGFHAQWSAEAKEYRYRIAAGSGAPDRWAPFAWRAREHPRVGRDPDPLRLREIAARFVGERDFIAFHEKSSPRRARRIDSASVEELGGGVFELRIAGSGFGRHQVRYLAGAAVQVAAGALPESDLAAALETAAPIAGVKAPAAGLVLWEVRYPLDLDPFGPEDRAAAPGLPAEPPFVTG